MVTIHGITGVTPLTGDDWTITPVGDSEVMECEGPATARIHMAGGNLVEVDCPADKTVRITITGGNAVVEFV